MHWFAIVIYCVIACVVYGIVHDQITARICVEYFTIGHPMILPTTDPTTLGVVWGIVATWWVGVMLGVPLATVARFGGWPKRSADSLLKSILILMGVSGVCALAAGVLGNVAADQHWVSLQGELYRRVPEEQHVAFLTALFAHSASYLAGFVGGLVLIVRVAYGRWAQSKRELMD